MRAYYMRAYDQSSRGADPRRAHGGPVGADLRPRAAELRGVEAEGDDGVGALGLRLLHEALGGVRPALREHLRHALELAPDQRLEPRADLGAEVARAHGEPEHLAEDLVDAVAGEVVH